MSELANGAVAVSGVSGATNRDRYRALTDIRVQDPEAIRRAADARTKRSLSGDDGRLILRGNE